MNTAVMTPRIAKASTDFHAPGFNGPDFRTPDFRDPGFRASGSAALGFGAKTAGVVSLLGVLTAACAEILFLDRLNVSGGLVVVLAMIAVTLPFYDTLSPLNRRLSLLAASFNLVGLAFEVPRLQSHGVNIAVVFNGFFCILIGYLVSRSTFLPRILGALMVLGGVGWLTFLSSSLTNYLAPYNLAFGLLGEGLACLWFLVTGVNVRRRKERAGGAGASIAAEAATLSRATVISAQR
jgi:hypothetical protein